MSCSGWMPCSPRITLNQIAAAAAFETACQEYKNALKREWELHQGKDISYYDAWEASRAAIKTKYHNTKFVAETQLPKTYCKRIREKYEPFNVTVT